MTPTATKHKERTDRSTWLRLALFFVVIITALLLGRHYQATDAHPLAGLLDRSGFEAAVLFIVLFVVLTLAFAPATPLVVAGGVLFGALWGTVLAWTAGTASALLAYVIGRTGGGGIHRVLGTRLEALEHRVDLSAISTIMLLRMVLVFPFSVLNYALGVARVPPRRYLVGTMLGNLPWMLAFALLGAALGSFEIARLDDPRFLFAILGGSIGVITLFALGRSWAGRWHARRALDAT